MVGGHPRTSACFKTPPEACGTIHEDGAATLMLSPRGHAALQRCGEVSPSHAKMQHWDPAGTSPVPRQSDLTLIGSRVPLPLVLTSSGIAKVKTAIVTLI